MNGGGSIYRDEANLQRLISEAVKAELASIQPVIAGMQESLAPAKIGEYVQNALADLSYKQNIAAEQTESIRQMALDAIMNDGRAMGGEGERLYKYIQSIDEEDVREEALSRFAGAVRGAVDATYPVPVGKWATRFTHLNPEQHGFAVRPQDKAYFDENGKMIPDRFNSYAHKGYNDLVSRHLPSMLNKLDMELRREYDARRQDTPAQQQDAVGPQDAAAPDQPPVDQGGGVAPTE